MRLSVAEILQATDGKLATESSDRKVMATGVSWDSRTIAAGDLYVALPGERVDGHDFAAAACEAGAVAVLAARPLSLDVPVIVVADTMQALSMLASFWRARLKGTVVGLTGSTGKTTTKNLVRDVLSAAGTVVATKANQNNELGVPATLLTADEDTDFVVVEMGMRGLGQIAELCAITRPDWGLITNVGESHIELLGSRENIARAKAELFEALSEGGVAFVNGADDYAAYVVDHAKLGERGVRTVFFDGSIDWPHLNELGVFENNEPVVCADFISLDAEGKPSFRMNALSMPQGPQNEHEQCELALRGVHNVSNACSAAAVGLMAGLTLAQCVEALSSAQPEAGRQQVLRAPSGVLVVDDSYNANPDSMRASLATFAALAAEGRHIAVLGDMGELGDFAEECHRRVGSYAARAALDCLVCVGELSSNIASEAVACGFAADAVHEFETNEDACAFLDSLLEPGDIVLVKASHFMEFSKIVERLVG